MPEQNQQARSESGVTVNSAEQLQLLANASLQINELSTRQEISDFVCHQIKTFIGRGYVAVTLLDEATQTFGITSLYGLEDEGIISQGLRVAGTDPRKLRVPVSDFTEEELAGFHSGRLELITGGLYELLVRKYPRPVCHALEALLGIHFIYTIGFVRRGNHVGGLAILTDSKTAVENNKAFIENLTMQAAAFIARLQAEESLRENEKRLRLATKATRSGIYAYDLVTGRSYYSPEFLEIYGLEPDGKLELDSDLVPKAIFPDDKAAFLKNMNAANDPNGPGVFDTEFRIRRSDGKVRWIHVQGQTTFEGDGSRRHAVQANGVIQDITQARETREALKESEEKFRLAFMTGPDAFYLTTLEEGRIIEVNDNFARVYGYPRDEVIGRTSLQLGLYKNPPDRAGMVSELRATGMVKDLELQGRKKDGGLITISLSGSIMTMNGVKYILGVIRDITERKKADEALKESREQYRVLVDNANEAIVVAQEGRLTFFNRTAYDLFPGYSEQELIGKPFTDFVHPEDRSRIVENFAKRLNNEPVQPRNQYRLLMHDGTVKWAELGTALIAWKGKPATLNFITDVTPEKTAEQALRESEAKFRALIEKAPIAISLSRNGVILYANQKLAQLVRIQSPEAMIGHEMAEYFAPQCREEHRERRRRRLLGLPVPVDFESTWLRSDGVQFPVHLFVAQIQLPEGPSNISFVTDISDRKKAEAETQALQEKAQISNRLAAVGEMAAGIAHEINNPLTGVIGFSELLLQEDLPEDIHEQLKIIADGSNRVKEIVKRMLSFARQNKPERKRVNISEVIDATLDLMSYALRTSNIEVVKNYDPGLPWILVDPGQMQQMFLNLIVNAEYSMKKAHGKGTLTIITEKTGDNIRISFKDDGSGMDKETKNKLFNPFFTTKPVGEGTGLGLTLSRSIILVHGGTLDIESEPGMGAVFIITLPIVLDENVSDAEDLPNAQARGTATPSRILVVDDEESIRRLVGTVLTKNGDLVDVTGEAIEAFEKLGNHAYDAIIMDIRMPGLSGIEQYDLIIVAHPEMIGKFLFMTGDNSGSDTKSFLERNHLPSIMKPFDNETLIAKVKSITGHGLLK